MWVHILLRILESSKPQTSRDGDVCGEIIGYQGWLDASRQKTLVTNPVRKLSAAYAAAETLWYLRGTAATDMLERYAPSYKKYAPDGRAFGAYGPRVMPQMEPACNTLRRAVHSRQSVVGIWRATDVVVAQVENDVKDMPCTLSWQFVVRDEKLHMIVTMRSNDAWLGFPYDVFAFTCFQRLVATEVGFDVGYYCHQAGSMHLYERDRARARLAIERFHSGECLRELSHGWLAADNLESAKNAVADEQELRLRMPLFTSRPKGDMMRDLVAACATKLGGYDYVPRSEAMRCLC